MPPQKTPAVQRFWPKVDMDGPIPECRPDLGNCWIWTASFTTYGYGAFDHNSAHVFAYKLSGRTIPDGMELDHLCRNRACVRASHLEPVSSRENILRGIGTAAINVRKQFCIHGHPFDEKNTYLRKTGRACRACVRKRTNEYFRRKRNAKEVRS